MKIPAECKATVALPGYPAILDEHQVAIWLGLNHRELKALVRAGHLLPLGKARSRTQKRFAAVYILQAKGSRLAVHGP